MKKMKELDELQLLKRGNIFKHGLFALGGLLLVNALLYSCGIEWTSGKWDELTIILFTVALCSIEFIWYDIYPLTENKQKFAIYFLGLIGLASIITGIYDLLAEKGKFLVDGKLIGGALGIIHGILFLAVFLAYILKRNDNSRHENDE